MPASPSSPEEHAPPQSGNLITAIGNKVRGIKAYRQAKQEMRSVSGDVWRAVSEQVFDKEGNLLPCVVYGAELHLRSPVTKAEQKQFLQEYHQNVMERWPEDELLSGPDDPYDNLLSRWNGHMSDNVRCSLVGPLPQVNYDTTGMSEKQVRDLRDDAWLIYNYSNAHMNVTLEPIGKPHLLARQEPEILRMDANPTHRVEIQAMRYGFKQQGEIAAQILACITETSVMRDKLPPADMSPLLPPGQ